eukprot:CAMPEP_0115429586 /NCGR_PEP_ID=MMETSP0271-20121206/30594_1 /TAXON_ID=71861 /ORGANISM="Scrippsiella trochoidea, Strain CCMP3099" /LENGTH=245 /DNA_ID=CAMNT_0002854765 /DNA_START=61 /DNA_END=799 /DNA_ORIENTATION=-
MAARTFLAAAAAVAAAVAPSAMATATATAAPPLPSAGPSLRGGSNVSSRSAPPRRDSASTTAQPGCVRVEEFVVLNRCDKTIFLEGWDQLIGPGETTTISTVRTSDLQRISWRFQDGPWAHDYIELNGDWAAAGTEYCSHPNYATWYGFTTSSRYEALEVGTDKLACADGGAEVTFSTGSCPEGYGPSDALACDFHATQASIRDCISVPALYQEAHTWAINGDGYAHSASRARKEAQAASGVAIG